MPIRFRCEHCNQLMGIAHRKAGKTVQCPNCHNSVTVPLSESAPVATSAPPAPLFEREDFDDFLHPSASSPARPAPPPLPLPPGPMPGPMPQPFAPMGPMGGTLPAIVPPEQPGVVVSPTLATVLTVGLIVLLAIAFGAGLLVGRFYLAT